MQYILYKLALNFNHLNHLCILLYGIHINIQISTEKFSNNHSKIDRIWLKHIVALQLEQSPWDLRSSGGVQVIRADY